MSNVLLSQYIIILFFDVDVVCIINFAFVRIVTKMQQYELHFELHFYSLAPCLATRPAFRLARRSEYLGKMEQTVQSYNNKTKNCPSCLDVCVTK